MLDRRERNVAFLPRLMESGVDFVAIDTEHANRMTIHILAAVAEGEAKAISDRTKTALAAAKARGTKLGSTRPGHWAGREDDRLRGARNGAKAAAVTREAKADEFCSGLIPKVRSLRNNGVSLQAIADALYAEGETTPRGGEWNAVQVMRVLARSEN